MSAQTCAGAGSPDWNWATGYAERIRISTGKESNLSSVQTGGLEGDLVGAILGDVEALLGHAALDRLLRPFVGAPSRHGLQEGHGAILGSYGQEDAAAWIDEHADAMKAGALDGSSAP